MGLAQYLSHLKQAIMSWPLDWSSYFSCKHFLLPTLYLFPELLVNSECFVLLTRSNWAKNDVCSFHLAMQVSILIAMGKVFILIAMGKNNNKIFFFRGDMKKPCTHNVSPAALQCVGVKCWIKTSSLFPHWLGSDIVRIQHWYKNRLISNASSTWSL